MSESNKLNNLANFTKSFDDSISTKVSTASLLKTGIFSQSEHPHISTILPSSVPILKGAISFVEGIFEFAYHKHKVSEATKLIKGLPVGVSEFQNKFLPQVIAAIEHDKEIGDLFEKIDEDNNNEYFSQLGYDCARTIWKGLKTGFFQNARGHVDEDSEVINSMISILKKQLTETISHQQPIQENHYLETETASLLHNYQQYQEGYIAGDSLDISE